MAPGVCDIPGGTNVVVGGVSVVVEYVTLGGILVVRGSVVGDWMVVGVPLV